MSKTIVIALIFVLVCCSPSPTKERGERLFNNYCASCHLAPSVSDLPRNIWATYILPEMGARMGILDSGYNPYKGISFSEQSAILKTNVYPSRPILSKEDWELIKNYVLETAPDSLEIRYPSNTPSELARFNPEPISVDSFPGSFITFIRYDQSSQKLNLGDIRGNLYSYDVEEKRSLPMGRYGVGIVDYTEKEGVKYITSVGQLNPSELASGRIFINADNKTTLLPQVLHRPVNTLVADLDKDGSEELVVSEFGDLTGELALFSKNGNTQYKKEVLLGQPGSNRVIAKDMDRDGMEDLIVQTAQGDEGITIFYQEGGLEFRAEKVIRVSPLYGSSWFELVDYNGDGYDDIVTVNGDNADKSIVLKPYHGLRIYINDGDNHFKESYFYAMNGATRLVARDFDQDGDIDFGIVSTFPDYQRQPEISFVYLENTDPKNYKLEPYTFKGSQMGRWFLMDSADVDLDGDEDIILSSFTYNYSDIPAEFSKLWDENNVDVMILRNKLKN
ncbi:FG-GAP-like repeat-containing protein [Flavobacteriaceae bacterium F89]|uniref:FG-GAP-like repeat-containing protein n=1 Tax=Cerina litoralis TaxID=2874477 RepID=A0AAE3EVP4_9FLAO|nr:FG-GAP-like repeat-containing protein [Cerina litoralis]MCG2461813.1 FG-GAP-like repeat-containing protein [Cerina litoralis]